MSQYQTTAPRRAGGDINVYTGLLFVATIVLAVGVFILIQSNLTHSGDANGNGGGVFHISD